MDPNLLSLLKPVVTLVANRTIDALATKIGALKTINPTVVESNLLAHLDEVSNWSDRVEFYGLSQAMHLDEVTVALDIALTPRKFVGRHAPREWTEDDLLAARDHHLLLGDPGAGKSTTVKRLCRRLLTTDSLSDGDRLQYPLVLRFRTIKDSEGVHDRLAKALGIRWEFEKLDQSDRHSGKEPRKLVGDVELIDALILVVDETHPLICLVRF